MTKPIHEEAWHLPWRGKDVPHALIDITRRCSISCRSCYNTSDGADKPLEEVQAEIRELGSRRNLNSISIVGGEPMLHPALPEIVRCIRAAGLHAELFTNGVQLDEESARVLAQAGLEVAFLHLQTGQRRPDLPEGYHFRDLDRLLREKSALLHRHGIEAGLAVTAYPDRPEELLWAVDSSLNLPQLGYLLVTLDRDVRGMALLEGDLDRGFTSAGAAGGDGADDGSWMAALVETMQGERGLRPFCYLGSNLDHRDPRWVSFMALCAYRGGDMTDRVSLGASAAEKCYLRLARALQGRYPFYSRQRQGTLKVQLFLNALSGGSFGANLRFLARTLGGRRDIGAKKILFQSLAHVGRDGRLVHCAGCPDAVMKKGRLVPVCISDRVRE